MTFTPVTRRGGRETSQEAAVSAQAGRWRVSDHVHDLFRTFGAMTDEQMIRRYYEDVDQGARPMASESGLRSRRAELVGLRVLRDSGNRDFTEAGRRSIVWEAVAGNVVAMSAPHPVADLPQGRRGSLRAGLHGVKEYVPDVNERCEKDEAAPSIAAAKRALAEARGGR